MRRAKRALAIVAFTTLVSCAPRNLPAATPTSNSIVLRLYHAPAIESLAHELTTAYQASHPNIIFELQSAYSTRATQLLENSGSALYLDIFRPEDHFWAAPIGQTGIAIIVNQENPLLGLSLEQVRGIFQGRVTRWLSPWNDDDRIVVLSRESESAARYEFEKQVLGHRRITPNARIATSNRALLSQIGTIPGSIGYTFLHELSDIDAVKPVAINGISPTQTTIGNNAYPLRSTIFVIGVDEPDDHYRAFVGWVQSADGQNIVAKRHVPLPR